MEGNRGEPTRQNMSLQTKFELGDLSKILKLVPEKRRELPV